MIGGRAFRWIFVSVIVVAVLRAAPAYPVTGPFFAVAVDPKTPTILYAATGSGVAKSTDGGLTWNDTGLTTREHYALAIDPVTPTTVYAGRNGAIAKSTDGGASWKGVSILDEPRDLIIDYATPIVVYAVVHAASGLLKSTDGGDSWTAIGPSDKFLLSLAIDPVTSTTVYGAWFERTTGTCCSVLKSTDSGATWVKQGEVLAYAFLAIDPVTPTTLYAGTDDGIFKSIDGGVTWFAAGPVAYAIAIDPRTPTTLYAAYTKLECGGIFGPEDCTETGAIYKSTDGAATWAQVADILAYNLAIDPVTPTTLYAGAYGVLKSTDGGATWAAPPPPTPTPEPVPAPTDTAPPDTAITSAIDDGGAAVLDQVTTLSTSVTLTFTGTDDRGVARFECRLDGADFITCTSPRTYNGLALGRHTVEVRAVDTSNNVDPTPARLTWTVDAPPETTFTSAADGRGRPIANGGITTSGTITLRFTGTDNGMVTGFECRLDAGYFTSCASPLTYTSVTRGTHTFQVRAIDNNGFRDPTPAIFKWTRTND